MRMGTFVERFSKILAVPLIARRLLSRKDAAGTSFAKDAPAPALSHDQPQAQSQKQKTGVMTLAKSSVSRFLDDDCMTMAAALAYYTIFSIAPLLLIVIAIAGVAFGREAVQHEITGQVRALIGEGAESQVGAMVRNAAQHSS